jgi:hypothetical protein
MLSRKFYVLLARKFLTRRPPVTSVQYPVWADMVHLAADALETTSGGFNREKFLLAAGDVATIAAAD